VAQEEQEMLRKVVLASIAVASFSLMLAGSASSAQAQAWRGGSNGDRAYSRGYHEGESNRRWHWRHHHRYFQPPSWRRWHWSRQAPPPGYYYGRPVPPRP
jgi:hypothetical protein